MKKPKLLHGIREQIRVALNALIFIYKKLNGIADHLVYETIWGYKEG